MDTNRNESAAISQRKQIRAAIDSGGAFTAIEGLSQFGSLSFAKRISELKQSGYPIKKEWITTPSGKHVIRYSKAIN